MLRPREAVVCSRIQARALQARGIAGPRRQRGILCLIVPLLLGVCAPAAIIRASVKRKRRRATRMGDAVHRVAAVAAVAAASMPQRRHSVRLTKHAS
jgi:hypothetical protein